MNKKKQRAKDVLRQATAEEIKSAIDNYFSREPLLTPRLKNWEEDLPENNAKQTVPGKLIQVTEINDTWMEIPRYENIMWGGSMVGRYCNDNSNCYSLMGGGGLIPLDV
ncbi:hypothetical protein [Enterobacter cancerogenus]|uniref:hypothetical protein n=1 Tax=Enterobacter cancerogenus TaxID=69218 RepID=UPI00129973C4|nr:hypothetical protein [Enterobacter cancerogenus]QGG07964.1 hypothetical protein GH771_04220 [Enterobacter cancerogenus]